MKKFISILLISIMFVGGVSIEAFAGSSKPALINAWGYSAYKGAAIEWAPFSRGGLTYNVYRNGKLIKRNATSKSYNNNNLLSYYDRTGAEGGKSYTYRVEAVTNNNKLFARSKDITINSIAPMYISITFRRARTLTAHDGTGARASFSRGETVKAHSFKFGQYIFRYNGHIFHVNYNSVTNFRLHTTKQYSNRIWKWKEAEYFVNTSGVDSDTNYLIWASLYTQRMYVFKGSKGKWRLLKDKNNWNHYWKISSGKATSPSPAGLYFQTYKKQRRKNNVNYWSYYHSQTSLHGVVGNQDLERPRSEGCIRNPDRHAYKLYYNIPIGTRVIIY